MFAKAIDDIRPAKVFIDVTGLGAGVVDRLLEMGYHVVEGINFSQSPLDDRVYLNKRAEMWGELRDWLASIRPPGVKGAHKPPEAKADDEPSDRELLDDRRDALVERLLAAAS